MRSSIMIYWFIEVSIQTVRHMKVVARFALAHSIFVRHALAILVDE